MKILDSEMVLWEDIDVFIQPLMVVNYSRSARKAVPIVLLEVVLRYTMIMLVGVMLSWGSNVASICLP